MRRAADYPHRRRGHARSGGLLEAENELAILAVGGSVALTMLGVTMPPVMLAVDPL
jgi:hypothetical protein